MSLQTLRAAIEHEVDRVGGLEPALRAREAQRLSVVLGKGRVSLRKVIQRALRQLMLDYGWSMTDCAKELRVTRQRVQGILRS